MAKTTLQSRILVRLNYWNLVPTILHAFPHVRDNHFCDQVFCGYNWRLLHHNIYYERCIHVPSQILAKISEFISQIETKRNRFYTVKEDEETKTRFSANCSRSIHGPITRSMNHRLHSVIKLRPLPPPKTGVVFDSGTQLYHRFHSHPLLTIA